MRASAARQDDFSGAHAREPLDGGRYAASGTTRAPTSAWALYRRRFAGEREFRRLKHDCGLAFLRVRGIERVRLHADLVMLARLALALERCRRLTT